MLQQAIDAVTPSQDSDEVGLHAACAYKLGRSYQELGWYEDAEAVYRHCLALGRHEPQYNYRLHVGCAESSVEMAGRLEEAEGHMREAEKKLAKFKNDNDYTRLYGRLLRVRADACEKRGEVERA